MRRAAALALLLAAGGAAAHPHGRLECRVRLAWEGGRLAAVEQHLVLDAASTAALAERLQPGVADAGKPVLLFRDLVLGLFRQSGWMLDLRPVGGAVGGEAAVPLDDRSAVWQRRGDGRLELALQLAPKGEVPATQQWALACRDPVWYWVAEFSGPAPVQAEGCQVQLDGPRDAAAEAATLQAAALRAGLAGAERVAPVVSSTTALGVGRAELRC
jgi:Protein of unknown function (DUF1007)